MFTGWLKSRWFFYLGRYLCRRKNFPGAVSCFEQIIALRPKALGAYVWLANCKIKSGAPLDAIPPLEQALRLKPDYATAHAYLGVALYKLGRYQEALDEFTRALRIKPRLKPDWILEGLAGTSLLCGRSVRRSGPTV